MHISCPAKFLFSLLLITSSYWGIGQPSVKEDSTFIAEVFGQILVHPENEDSLIGLIEDRTAFKSSDPNFLDNYYYHRSKFHFFTHKLDEAQQFSGLGLLLNSENREWRKMAKFYNIQAVVYSMKGEYSVSIESFNKSSRLMDNYGDHYAAALVKNNIANIFISLRDFNSAQSYAKESYEYLKSVNDTVYLPGVAGILAISEVGVKDIKAGEKHADECLILSEKYKSPIGLIVGNIAKGDVYQIEEKFDLAVNSYEQSLDLSIAYGQPHYVLLNETALAKVYFLTGDFKISIEYGEKALSESEGQNNTNVNYSIKKYLAYAYGNNEQFEKAFDLLQETHEQYLSQTDEKTRTIINDILIKYETEKTEKELTKKQLELAKTETDLNRKNVLLVLLFSGILVILLLYFIYRRIQHEKLVKLNFENEKNLLIALSEGEEKERFRISNDLHDGLASSIAGVKMKVELEAEGENFDAIHLLNKLGELHEEVRRISHNLMPIDFESSDLRENLAKYCRENTSDGLRIHFNAGHSCPQINPQKAAVIYRVFQELLNNVRKHAKARSCFVNLSFQAEELTLSVEDDGVGFNSQESFDGQGLNSINKRLLIIEGAMGIESELGSGTLIIVSIKTV